MYELGPKIDKRIRGVPSVNEILTHVPQREKAVLELTANEIETLFTLGGLITSSGLAYTSGEIHGLNYKFAPNGYSERRVYALKAETFALRDHPIFVLHENTKVYMWTPKIITAVAEYHWSNKHPNPNQAGTRLISTGTKGITYLEGFTKAFGRLIERNFSSVGINSTYPSRAVARCIMIESLRHLKQ